jgi:hypothetical protein
MKQLPTDAQKNMENDGKIGRTKKRIKSKAKMK